MNILADTAYSEHIYFVSLLVLFKMFYWNVSSQNALRSYVTRVLNLII
jgi:hypothetical protein